RLTASLPPFRGLILNYKGAESSIITANRVFPDSCPMNSLLAVKAPMVIKIAIQINLFGH
ncbi:TPA: hypothetical protein ACGF4N_002523, partial [Vibrio cholerae]